MFSLGGNDDVDRTAERNHFVKHNTPGWYVGIAYVCCSHSPSHIFQFTL